MRLHLDSAISAPPDPRAHSVGSGGSAGASTGTDSAGSRDSIAISGTAAALNRVAAERATRVQQISDAVRGGGYRVASQVVASAIVAQAAS